MKVQLVLIGHLFLHHKVPLQFAYAEREIKVNTQFATLRVKTVLLIPLWKL